VQLPLRSEDQGVILKSKATMMTSKQI